MLEGLLQSYVEAFGRAWQPRDEIIWPHRGSKSGRTALRSHRIMEGETDECVADNPRGCAGGGRP